MSALKSLFGHDTKYYDLLEGAAAEAKTSAALLIRLAPQLGNSSEIDPLADVAQCRRKHKRLSQQTTAELCRNFVTPLEREDIEALSAALYKITKNVEKIAERLTIAPTGADTGRISRPLKLLEQAAVAVEVMVKHLRPRSHGELIKDEYDRLQAIEGDADKLMNELLRALYHGESDGRAVVFWKDVFELLERAVDRCRDAGYVVFHVALKYS